MALRSRPAFAGLALAVAVPAAAQYAVPFQLRPASAGNVARSDTALALFEPPGGAPGSTLVSTLLVSAQVVPDVAAFARAAYVSHAPGSGPGGQAVVNPILGAALSRKLSGELRLGVIFGASIPVGMGGGNDPDPGAAAAVKAGVLARSAMDNALFAVNDLVLLPGAGLAYVQGPFTAQVEVTLLQLIRVRGEAVQPDAARTNLTSGAYAGWFLLPQLSIGVELRYQRWLSTPAAVAANERLRDTLTIAAGARAHLKLGESLWLRPALAYALPLDNPMSGLGYQVLQLDLPMQF